MLINHDEYAQPLNQNNISSGLTCAEKTELAVQTFNTLFLQSAGAYFTLVGIPYFNNNKTLLYFSSAFSTLIGSSFSLYSLYQLGPYFSNARQLQRNMAYISHTYDTLTLEEARLKQQIKTLEKQVQKIMHHRAFNLFEDESNITIKNTLDKNTYAGIIEFLWDMVIGLGVGINFNEIFKLKPDELAHYLPAPLALSLVYGIMNKLIFTALRNEKIFIPSHLLMAHAFNETKAMRSRLETIIDKRHDHYDAQLAQLKSMTQHMSASFDIENPYTLPKEIKHTPFELILSDVDDFDVSVSQTNLPRNRCVAFGLAGLSMLPMLLNTAWAILAVESETDSGNVEENTVRYLPLLMIGITLLAWIWRMQRYHDTNHHSLQNFSIFSKEKYRDKIQTLENDFEESSTKINKLITRMQRRSSVALNSLPLALSTETTVASVPSDRLRVLRSTYFKKQLSINFVRNQHEIVRKCKEALNYETSLDNLRQYFAAHPDEYNALDSFDQSKKAKKPGRFSRRF